VENKHILKLLKQTAKLMELFGENDFKIKSYNSAIYNLEKADVRLADLDQSALEKLDGVGKSIAASIAEIIETGSLKQLTDYHDRTPEGVMEMMKLSGFGPKKIKLIWEDLGIDNLNDLIEACRQDKIAALKGFGAKSQNKMLESAKFLISRRGFVHYREAEKIAEALIEHLQELTDKNFVSTTGAVRRKMEVIKPIELLVGAKEKSKIKSSLEKSANYEVNEKLSGPYKLKLTEKETKAEIDIYFTPEENFANELYRTTANPQHLVHQTDKGESLYKLLKQENFKSEEAIFKAADLPFIAPELREGLWEFEMAKEGNMPKLIETDDLKGILHNHSTYSDGANTLEQMATYCKELGYEYSRISDHSKTAAYANGLQEFRVKQQHEEIDELNKKLAPFKIFKGIESDILNDGSLDYADDVLASFDFVVASIHAQLNMDEKTATERLIKAISNPFTTMLGHPTGRLLLQREAYPINHYAVIDACVEYNVIIEINAHPWRLDLDWRYVKYAIDKGVMISINPDAHETKGYHDMYYGVCVGRKAGLTAKETFNALSQKEVEAHFNKKKEAALQLIKS
jgi:DNA polymerase (family 10)